MPGIQPDAYYTNLIQLNSKEQVRIIKKISGSINILLENQKVL